METAKPYCFVVNVNVTTVIILMQFPCVRQLLSNRQTASFFPKIGFCLLVLIFTTLLTACSPEGEDLHEDGGDQNAKTVVEPAVENKPAPAAQAQEKSETDKLDNMILQNIYTPYIGKLPSLSKLNVRDAVLEEVITGLSEPWAFEFIDEDEVIVTEIGGKLSRFNLLTRQLTNISGLPEIATDRTQTGLLDVVLHPDFEKNSRLYFSYTARGEKTTKYYRTVVVSAILTGDRLHDLREITTPGDLGWSPSNFGGALEFDADGYLYIALGDRSEEELAQQGNRTEGKILRLHDDGTIPEDNPFVGNDKIDDRIYALGVRNPQGLHFDNVSGKLFETEHGPMGGDEVNIIVSGANYGWPFIGYGYDYKFVERPGGSHKEGLEQPLYYYLPSVATSPITVYRGQMFQDWDGDLLVGTLAGHHVSKIDLDNGVVRSERAFLQEIKGRIRDIKVAQDGSIFVLSQTGVLFRLYRDPTLKEEVKPYSDEFLYVLVCSGCHDSGINEAPVLGKKDDWKAIVELPVEQIYERVIEGYKLMPERGLCNLCTDEQLRSTVDYMLEQLTETE